jgi:hypothetical protein
MRKSTLTARGFALALGLSAALLALPGVALAAEACPNEQLRVASGSTQLPSCRAYELVSPGDAGGAVESNSLAEAANSTIYGGLFSPRVAEDGNLISRMHAAVNVQANGEDVFWNSQFATPPGTGAIEDAQLNDAFRSVRTPSGWSTRDLMPSGLQIPNAPGGLGKVLLGASADGSTALILTRLALYPSAYANPQEAALGEGESLVIYRVSTDGAFAPQLVSHGDFLLPDNAEMVPLTNTGPFEGLSATPSLGSVVFRSTLRLGSEDRCVSEGLQSGWSMATTYLWNANAIDGLAHTIVNLESPACTSPNVADVPTVLPNGRPILLPNPAGEPGGGPTMGPLVENAATLSFPGALTRLGGASGATLLSVTPDGATAYVQAAEALDSRFPGAATGTYNPSAGTASDGTCTGECQIYAVSTTQGTESIGGGTPGVTCISCSTDQTDVSYVTTSQDGAHVLFTTDQGLWEWDASTGATLLTGVTDLGPRTVIISENGEYIVGLTSQLANNPNGTADLYEFSAGRTPTPITSGTSPDSYILYVAGLNGNPNEARLASGVSDDGQRVVYNRQPPEVGGQQSPEVIDEWDAGETTQLSPVGSASDYSVQAVNGDQLQDVFFLAHDSIVPWDFNSGQADVYDARIDGGFPFCTSGNPGPPPGVERCGTTTSNANPTVAPPPAYGTNPTPAEFQLAPLAADTSQPPGKSTPKALTRAQKLVKALKVCRKKPQKQRAACKARAQKQFGAKASRRSKKGRK